MQCNGLEFVSLISVSVLITTGCSYDAFYNLLDFAYTGGVDESRRQHYDWKSTSRRCETRRRAGTEVF